MKRKILIAVLALGTVGGFAHGFASLHRGCHERDRMAEHLSRVCVDAAMDAAGRDEGGQSFADDDFANAHDGWRGRRMAHLENEVRQRCAHEGRRHR